MLSPELDTSRGRFPRPLTMRPPELLPPGPDDRYEAAAGGADSTPAVVGDRSRGDAHAQTGRRPAGGQQPRSRRWPDLNSAGPTAGAASGPSTKECVRSASEPILRSRSRARACHFFGHPQVERSASCPAEVSRRSGNLFDGLHLRTRVQRKNVPRFSAPRSWMTILKNSAATPAEDVDKSSFTAFSREAMAMNRSGLSRRSKKAKSCRIPSLPGSDAWVAVRGPCPKL